MNGIVSTRSAVNVLGIVAIAVAVAGCDSDAASRDVPVASVVESSFPDWVRGEQPVLRYQVDAARSRLWILTLDGVELYDVTTRRKVAQVALPGWLWVREQYNCSPDLAIGPGGEAVVSSNVVPTLWRVDPVTLAASKHEPVLDQDKGKDVGFTGLVYSARLRAFIGVSALHGSMWRIDPSFQRAMNIPLSEPLPKACGIAARLEAADQRAGRFAGFCVRADQGDWSVNLAPDQRSGYVRPGQCLI